MESSNTFGADLDSGYPLCELIRTMFQPIVSGAGSPRSILAFECLSRGPVGTPLESAAALFSRTRALGLEIDIDRACVWRALHTAHTNRVEHTLFLNVHAVTLRTDSRFVDYLAASVAGLAIPFERVVIEVTEHQRERFCDETGRALRELEAIGIAVALDDFGANQGDLDLLRRWTPAYVKLDRNLLRWARRSSAARQVIESAVRDSASRGSEVIAEGLEDDADLELAASLGIPYLQGYVVSRPLTPTTAALAQRFDSPDHSLAAVVS